MTHPEHGPFAHLDAAHAPRHRLHGTCVAIGPIGVLLRGRPGAGKSDLALRLICQPVTVPAIWPLDGSSREAVEVLPAQTARLVADDQVLIEHRRGQLIASPPPALAGLLEVRGLGILRIAIVPEIALALIVDLVGPSEVERLPPNLQSTEFIEWSLPQVRLTPFEVSAVAKVHLAARLVSSI